MRRRLNQITEGFIIAVGKSGLRESLSGLVIFGMNPGDRINENKIHYEEDSCYYKQSIQLRNTRQLQMPSLISSSPITKSMLYYWSTPVRVAKRLAIAVSISLCLPSQINHDHN